MSQIVLDLWNSGNGLDFISIAKSTIAKEKKQQLFPFKYQWNQD